MLGRDQYLLADHRFVVDRLVDAEVALERCRDQRAALLVVMVMVRSYLASPVDEREGMTDDVVVAGFLDPALAGFEMGDMVRDDAVLDEMMRNHPTRHRRG